MTIGEISFSVGKTQRLVQEYLDIIEKYKEQGYIMDLLMEYEVDMETAGEIYEPYYNSYKGGKRR